MMEVSEAKDYIGACNGTVIKLGTERISALLEVMGRPQDEMRIIQVAGTNGKGSFCTLLEAVMTAAGLSTGKFCSPSTVSINDTICANGRPITDYDFAECTEYVKSAAAKCPEQPTGFELETAVALEYFRRSRCGYAILEAGLGGRLDATNAVGRNILSVITGVALDHTAFLGKTTAEIAREKAGIIKRGSPVIYGGNDEAACEVIKKAAAEKNSRFIRAELNDICGERYSLYEGTDFSTGRYNNLHINMLGKFQVRNALVVLKAIEILREEGTEIPDIAVYEGFERAEHPGRFELLSREPVFISDGAHNIQGAESAAESIALYFGGEKLTFVSGVMADKDYSGIIRLLAPFAAEVFTAAPDNPRTLDAKALAEQYRGGGINATACASVGDAVAAALKTGRKIISLGSLYMYKDIIAAL